MTQEKINEKTMEHIIRMVGFFEKQNEITKDFTTLIKDITARLDKLESPKRW